MSTSFECPLSSDFSNDAESLSISLESYGDGLKDLPSSIVCDFALINIHSGTDNFLLYSRLG